eukprot:CAMPEP_0113518092 /NCGR_PEP_ID=MMETSP0014_2-20120614/42668_1 /TAXON_ID=2857 /ORGANISM="Nitzschia sp." /LENGTH=251 /DNA_ID=CAMNT_0000415453 /DNA_START=98 /DNA_END=853 /DNA_ORIENTATION=- /assembly_acc=CAM_ASM_000159
MKFSMRFGWCLIFLSLSSLTPSASCFNIHSGRSTSRLLASSPVASSSSSSLQSLASPLQRSKLSNNNVVGHSTSTTQLQASSSGSSDEVIIDRDFRLAGIFLALGLTIDTIVPYLGFGLGLFITLLGVLFLVQTFRLSFVCDSTSFSLQNTVKESGENVIVGGENKWTYDAFVNYDFFPKGWIDQPQGPILVYFKETQTPSDKWMEGPGASANSEEAVANGAVPGQVHFFPCIVNAKQLQEEWERRGCSKL